VLIWSFTEAEGIRRAIYDMLLLIFHLVLSAFRFEDVDVRKASRVLEWNLKRYPNGACVVCVIGDVCAYFLSPSPHIPLYPTLHQPWLYLEKTRILSVQNPTSTSPSSRQTNSQTIIGGSLPRAPGMSFVMGLP
jgi:hypothetical protein